MRPVRVSHRILPAVIRRFRVDASPVPEQHPAKGEENERDQEPIPPYPWTVNNTGGASKSNSLLVQLGGGEMMHSDATKKHTENEGRHFPRAALFTFSLVTVLGVFAAAGLAARAGAQNGTPGHLLPMEANVKQVAPEIVQFEMTLAKAPPFDPAPDHEVTFMWCVDTDRDPATGMRFGAGKVGSEFNVRVVLTTHPSHAGGFCDDVAGKRGMGSYSTFVDGERVYIRILLADLGNPSRFDWGCGAFATKTGGRNLDGPMIFESLPFRPADSQPVRVVMDPFVALQGGVASATPGVRAFNNKGAALDLSRRSVRFFAYSDLLQWRGSSVEAVPARAGRVRVTAAVDEVLSCNVAEVMVGSIEVVPAVMHLNRQARAQERVTLRVTDAFGNRVALAGHRVQFRTVSGKHDVVQLAPDGTVRAQPSGASHLERVVASFDGIEAANGCLIPVVEGASLQPAVEVSGRYVSLWYPPINTASAPPNARFEDVAVGRQSAEAYDCVYTCLRSLTGIVPFFGQRQHLAAVSVRSAFYSGNPVLAPFDVPWSARALLKADGAPWGKPIHEMGHNFTLWYDSSCLLGRLLFYGRLPSPLYVEGLANISALYVMHELGASPTAYGAPASYAPGLLGELGDLRRDWAGKALRSYQEKGSHYRPGIWNASDIDAFVGMLILLADRFGWDIYPRFFSIFWPPNEQLNFQTDTELGRATFFIAAISAAAKADLRKQFREWGFPCNDASYASLYPYLLRRASQRDGPATHGDLPHNTDAPKGSVPES